MRISKAFMVKGDAEKIFDLTEKYLPEMKYKRTTGVEPSSLVFERGGSLAAFVISPSVENVKVTLAISLPRKRARYTSYATMTLILAWELRTLRL